MTLELKNIHTTLGDRSFHFTLQAEAGTVHAILGKSGSGKSTLLNIVGGFINPDGGTLTWQGNSLIGIPPDVRPVTTLFQAHNLFDHLSIQHNVALGVSPNLTLNETMWAEVNQVLDDVGLAGRGNEKPGRLSGGEQQRVGLARCLLRKKPILLLDEPYGALDEFTRAEMLALTQQVIATRNLCVLLVTHNPDDATYLNAIPHTVVDGTLES